MRCEPANTIINRLGGLSAVAHAAGVTTHTVMRWRMPRGDKDRRNAGGTGGIIPHWHMFPILEAAAAKGVPLSPADFLPPAFPSMEDARGVSITVSELMSGTLPPNPSEVSESSSEISAFCSESSEPSPKHAEGDS